MKIPPKWSIHLVALDYSIDDDEVFTFSVASTGGVVPGLDVQVDGYSMEAAGTSDDTTLITSRALRLNSGSAFDLNRCRFYFLQSQEAQFNDDYPTTDSFTHDDKSKSFLTGVSSGPSIGYTVSPNILPREDDPVWGTLSGTLSFQQVQQNSVLFPTGRFAQMEYQLNASPGRESTPYLVSSQLDPGLRVGNIPANGAVDIYLRTNVPEGESIGDRTGKLKAVWELPE